MQTFQRTEFGEYILHDRIGAGGMAEIFLATARGIAGFEKRLVIKRILPTFSGDDQFVRMFIEEAKLCVSLRHPNIVQVYDLGEIDSQYFIAMEYVDGRDLLKTLAACGKKRIGFPTDIALYIVMEVLKGLDYAHGSRRPDGTPLGIIHRDVSPSNVLLSFEGEVKIADFGIAKASTREKTETGILKGKFGYMAPEQVTGAPIDHRADIFAMGIVLYELLTGHRLFAGKNDLAVLERVRDAQIEPPPRYYRPDLATELEEIVLRALSRDPRNRFQVAADLHDAIYDYTYRARATISPQHLGRFMQDLFLGEPEEIERRVRVALPAISAIALPPGPGPAASQGVFEAEAASSGGFDELTPLLELPGNASEANLAQSGLSELASQVVFIAPDEQWEKPASSLIENEDEEQPTPLISVAQARIAGSAALPPAWPELRSALPLGLGGTSSPEAPSEIGRAALVVEEVLAQPKRIERTAKTDVGIGDVEPSGDAIDVHTGQVLLVDVDGDAKTRGPSVIERQTAGRSDPPRPRPGHESIRPRTEPEERRRSLRGGRAESLRPRPSSPPSSIGAAPPTRAPSPAERADARGSVIAAIDEIRALRRSREENLETDLDLSEERGELSGAPVVSPALPGRRGAPDAPGHAKAPRAIGGARPIEARAASGLDTYVGAGELDRDENTSEEGEDRSFSPSEIVERTVSASGFAEDRPLGEADEEVASISGEVVEPTVELAKAARRRPTVDDDDLDEASPNDLISLEGGDSELDTTASTESPILGNLQLGGPEYDEPEDPSYGTIEVLESDLPTAEVPDSALYEIAVRLEAASKQRGAPFEPVTSASEHDDASIHEERTQTGRAQSAATIPEPVVSYEGTRSPSTTTMPEPVVSAEVRAPSATTAPEPVVSSALLRAVAREPSVEPVPPRDTMPYAQVHDDGSSHGAPSFAEAMEPSDLPTDDYLAVVPLGEEGSGLLEKTQSNAGLPQIFDEPRDTARDFEALEATQEGEELGQSFEASTEGEAQPYHPPSQHGSGPAEAAGRSATLEARGRALSRRRPITGRARSVLEPVEEAPREAPLPREGSRPGSRVRRASLRAASNVPRRRLTARSSLSVVNPQGPPPIVQPRAKSVQEEPPGDLTGLGYLVEEHTASGEMAAAPRASSLVGILDRPPDRNLSHLPERRTSSGVTAALDEAAQIEEELLQIKSGGYPVPEAEPRSPTDSGSLYPDGEVDEEIDDNGKTDLHDAAMKHESRRRFSTNGVVLFGEDDSGTGEAFSAREDSHSVPVITSAGRLRDEGASDLFGALAMLEHSPLELAPSFAPMEEPSIDTESHEQRGLAELRGELRRGARDDRRVLAPSVTMERRISEQEEEEERERVDSKTGLGSLTGDGEYEPAIAVEGEDGPLSRSGLGRGGASGGRLNPGGAGRRDHLDPADEPTASVTDGQVMDVSAVMRSANPPGDDDAVIVEVGTGRGARPGSGIEIDFSSIGTGRDDEAEEDGGEPIEELDGSVSTAVGDDEVIEALRPKWRPASLPGPAERGRSLRRENLAPSRSMSFSRAGEDYTPEAGLSAPAALDEDSGIELEGGHAELRLVSDSFDLSAPSPGSTRSIVEEREEERPRARGSIAPPTPAPKAEAGNGAANGKARSRPDAAPPIRAAVERSRPAKEVLRPGAARREGGAGERSVPSGATNGAMNGAMNGAKGARPMTANAMAAAARSAPTPVVFLPHGGQSYVPGRGSVTTTSTGMNRLLTVVVLLATVLAVAAAVTLFLERGRPLNAISIRPSGPREEPKPVDDPPLGAAGTAGTAAKPGSAAGDGALPVPPVPARAPAEGTEPERPGEAAAAAGGGAAPAGGGDVIPASTTQAGPAEETSDPPKAPARKKPRKASKKAPAQPAKTTRPAPVDPTSGQISIDCAEPSTVTVSGKGKFTDMTRGSIRVDPGQYLVVITRNKVRLKGVTVNVIAGQPVKIRCED